MDRIKAFFQRFTDESRRAENAQRAMLVALALCLLITPLMLGGRHDVGKLAYVVLVGLATIAWQFAGGTRKPIALPRTTLVVLLAVLAIPLSQMIPLPTGLLDAVSPNRIDLLPTWTSAGAGSPWGDWRTTSFTFHQTGLGLALATAHVALFVVAFQTIRRREDVRLVLAIVAGVAVTIALVGVAQSLSPNGKVMWVYDYPFRRMGPIAQGPFTTPNHFAHLVVLGVGPLLYFLLRTLRTGPLAAGKRKTEQAGAALAKTLASLCAVGVLASVVAVLMSYSRGALGALVLAGSVTGLLAAKAGWLRFRQVALGAGVTVLAGVIACSFGYGDRQQGSAARNLTTVEDWQDDNGRVPIWMANLRAFASNPWSGYGIGSHRYVYHAFIEEPAATEFTHAESSYLQVATECGVPGVVTLLAALGLIGWWCVDGVRNSQDADDTAMWAAIVAGLAVSLSHALVDFVWYIPACLASAIVLAACAARLHQLTAREHTPDTHRSEQSPAWLGLAPAGCVLAMTCAATSLLPAARASITWDNYLRAGRALDFVSQRQLDVVDQQMQLRCSQERDYYLSEMIRQLDQTLAARPWDARAHERAAQRCLQRFEVSRLTSDNPMALPAIRDAALASKFADQAALGEWLNNAFGEDAQLLFKAQRHAEQAVRLNPLLADAYLQLAQLDFISPQTLPNAEALTDQALTLCPLDGGILYQVGLIRQMAGDIQGWLDYWRHAITLPGVHRHRMLAQLACCVPAGVLVEEFPLDWELIQYAKHTYQNSGDLGSLGELAAYALQQMDQADPDLDSTEAAFHWRQVSAMQLALGDTQQAKRCAEQACELAPHDFHARFALVQALVKEDDFQNADPHLRWCAARRPDIVCLQNWLRQSAKDRLSRAVSGPPAFADTTRVAVRPTQQSSPSLRQDLSGVRPK